MAYFEKLNEGILVIMDMLTDNQNLCKLLAYNDDSPLSPSKPNIENTGSLIMKNIFPLPKPPFAKEDRVSYLTVILSDAKLHNNRQGFKEYKIMINIVCHIDQWKIVEGIRPLLISNELDKIFNKTRNAELTVGESLFNDWIYRQYSDYFCGYYQSYILTNFNF